jgi:hypothetical protein
VIANVSTIALTTLLLVILYNVKGHAPDELADEVPIQSIKSFRTNILDFSTKLHPRTICSHSFDKY